MNEEERTVGEMNADEIKSATVRRLRARVTEIIHAKDALFGEGFECKKQRLRELDRELESIARELQNRLVNSARSRE